MRPAVSVIKLVIRGYQKFLNPMLKAVSGPQGACRFSPSCSHYFYQAVDTHGAVRGSLLGVRRLCRCHPWGGYGDDPVPPLKKISEK